MYTSLSRFAADDKRAGGYMFSRDTMRFFGTIRRMSGMWRGCCILYNSNAPGPDKYSAYTCEPGNSHHIGSATTKRGAREVINDYLYKQTHP